VKEEPTIRWADSDDPPERPKMSHVDLHLHLLPGVDDGPPDEAASLVHAERLAREGVHEATVTPHVGHPDYPLDVATIAERTRALQAAIAAEGIELLLHPGGEIHPLGAALAPGELDLIAHGPRGARWVLFEVPFAGIDAEWLAACRHIRESGFSLLIAHPERAAGFLTGGHDLLRPELSAGALLQVNVCSLLGRYGPEAHEGAVRLVRDGDAYVLASDGHGSVNRAHTLAAGPAAALAAGVSPLRVEQLTRANPRFLLRDGIPREPRPLQSPRRPRVTTALNRR
jgi:protein-tyrosine phosphatase